MATRRKNRGPAVTPGKIAAIGMIYLVISAAWMILGASVHARTGATESWGGEAVEALWGSEQRQQPPQAWCVWGEEQVVPERRGKTTVNTVRIVQRREALPVIGSNLRVKFGWEPRRKGLLWYRTYRVRFEGDYTFRHAHQHPHAAQVQFSFPAQQAIYDDFRFTVNGRESEQSINAEQGIQERTQLASGGDLRVGVTYGSQGLDRWVYHFGDSVSRVRNFHLAMSTDFREIDFPAQSLSPTRKQAAGKGWELDWSYKSLISGFQIGMEMPQKLNPGPLAARMSFFAPVSLLFFFAMIFIITVVRDIRLHPMHYLFLGCSFFSFHLLFAYVVDRMLPLPAFLLCAVVSVGLVVSYLRLVTGMRFAVVEAGLSQLVYLILFSYAFFFEGYTGLAITLLSILSLFVVMHLTGRIDWEEKFSTPPAGKTGSTPRPREPGMPAGMA